MWWLALLGCQEPFGADRHDLVGFRIAALTASVDGDRVRPRVALIVDGRPWSDGDVGLAWSWIEAPGASMDLEGPPTALGPSPDLAREGGRLALVATRGGEVRRAELDVGGSFEAGVQVARIERSVFEVDGDDLALDRRATWPTTPGRSAPVDGFLRVALTGGGPGALGRFMSTRGTWFELEDRVADWTPGELVVDDGEVVEREAGEPGVVTVIGLVLDGGGGAWVDADVLAGEEVVSGAWIGGRLLPGPAVAGRRWVTLRADDESPCGLRFDDPEEAALEEVWDAAASGCVGVQGDFRPTWLLEGRCSRAALDGARATIEVDP